MSCQAIITRYARQKEDLRCMVVKHIELTDNFSDKATTSQILKHFEQHGLKRRTITRDGIDLTEILDSLGRAKEKTGGAMTFRYIRLK